VRVHTVTDPLAADEGGESLVVVGDVGLVAAAAHAVVGQGVLRMIISLSLGAGGVAGRLTGLQSLADACPPQICGQELVSARHHD